MIALLLANWKIGAGLLAGFVLSLMTVVPIVHHFAYNSGVSVGEANVKRQIAVDTLKTEQQRVKSDARLRNLSDHDLCVSGLQRRQLPIDACGSLKP